MQASSSVLINAKQRLLKNGVKFACLLQSQNNANVQPKKQPSIFQVKAKPSAKASICISINRGHFHTHANLAQNSDKELDPFPEGFAHLLEHMLFTASKQYAKVDALDQHLFSCHGQVNGWTQDLSTHFTVECAPEGFIQACNILIDRLSQPLFLHEHIAAEISAIDAEFKSKKDSFVRQLLSVQKASCNPAHPFARFSTGNKETLYSKQTQQVTAHKNSPQTKQLAEIQKQLFKFHQLTMQGPHICVCIGIPEGKIAAQDIAQLESLLEQAFQANPNGIAANHETKTNKSNSTVPLYLPAHLGQFIQMKSSQTESQLLFSYLLPDIQPDARDSLFIMLTHTIECKHQQGLFDTLRERQLIHDLHAYYKALDNNLDELVISMQLTPLGLKECEQVQQVMHEYMTFLQKTGFDDWRYREKQKQFELQSQLQKPAGLFENCINVAQLLHKKDISACLQVAEFDASLAQHATPEALSNLHEDNLRVYLISPEAETNARTEHYEAEYKIQALNKQSTKLPKLNTSFARARQNPFMTTQHQLIQSELSATTLRVFKQNKAELKFYQDIRLGLPNGECYLSITDPNMHASAQKVAIKRVWLACLQEHLARQFFDVELASIHFRVYAHQHGISIHTGGLSERQLLLCIELMNAIRAFKAKASNIQEQIYKSISSLKTVVNQKPFNRLFSYLNEFYQDPNKTNSSVLNALNTLKVEDVLSCQSSYFEDNYIESLLVGNWTLSSAERFFNQVTKRFAVANVLSKPCTKAREIVDTQHIHFAQESKGESNLIRHFIPVLNAHEQALASSDKAFNLKLAARSLIIEKLMSPHVFSILRQKYKMGYMLGIGYKPIGGFPGVAIYITSPTHTPNEAYKAKNEAIVKALTQFKNKREILSHLVEDLVNQVTPKEPDISQIASRIWMHYEDTEPALAYKDLIHALHNLQAKEIEAALQMFLQNEFGQIVLSQSAEQNITLE